MSNFLRIERIREAVTKTAKLLVRGKVEVTQQGATPFVRYNHDGTIACVNLPMIPDKASSDFLDAVQGFIDHEVAHVLFTDKLAEIEVLNRGAEEGLPMDRIATMSNAFEDVRIERLMKLEYEGAAYNLTRSLAFVMGSSIKDSLTTCDSLPSEQRSQARAMNAMLVWIRARSGDHNAQLFIDENDLQADFALLDELFPSMGERIAALETSADAAQLGIDFVRAIMPPSPPEEPSLGEGDDDADDSDSGDGDEKRDNPSLGETEDGTSDDEADDDEGDDEGDDDDAEQDDDADEGEGQGSGDEESDEGDDDSEGGDAETPDDAEGEDEGEGGSGDDADDDGDDSDSDAERPDGDVSEKPGKSDDSDDKPAEDKDDTEEKSGKKSKSRRVTEAMKSLNPYYRSLIADTMRKKQSVSDLSRKHSKPTDAIKDDLRNARRQFREAYKGV